MSHLILFTYFKGSTDCKWFQMNPCTLFGYFHSISLILVLVWVLKAPSQGAMCDCDLLYQEMECCLRFSDFVHKVRWVWMRFPMYLHEMLLKFYCSLLSFNFKSSNSTDISHFKWLIFARLFSSIILLHLFLCLDLSELPDLTWKSFSVEEEFKAENIIMKFLHQFNFNFTSSKALSR